MQMQSPTSNSSLSPSPKGITPCAFAIDTSCSSSLDAVNSLGLNRETLQAMEDALQGRNLIGPFTSISDMWDAILSDDAE